ncbi:MAG TPA: T9SS type A sorting domain-containing protein [Chitinophagaceae bacterium]
MRKISTLLLSAGLSLGAGAQWAGFGPFASFAAGDDVRLVHTDDVTGDAVPDLTVLYTAGHTSFGLMAGRCDGSFGGVQVKPKEDNYFLSDIADLDGDGHADMVISSYWNNGFRIFFGEGGGQLREGPFLATGVHGRSIRCVDINKDGKMDVVSTTSGSGRTIHLHVFLGRGDGTFADKKTFPSVLDTCKDIIITDKNGDGRLDVVATSSFPWIVLFRQGSDGSFEPLYYPTWTPARVAFADVNRDSREDMVLLYSSFDNTPGSDSLVVRLNTGGDDFAPSVKVQGLGEHRLRPSYLQVGDLDRDGFKDLLFNHHDGEGNPTDTLFYLRGREGVQFEAPVFLVAPGTVLYSGLADLDGDGWPDLVVSTGGGKVNIALNRRGRQEEPGQFLVYPNPAGSWMMVQSGVKGKHSIRLYNAAGQLVRQEQREDMVSRVDTQQLPGGLYYVQVSTGEASRVQAVVVRH